MSTFLKLKQYIIHEQKYPVIEAQGEFDIETSCELVYDLGLLLEEIKDSSVE